MSATAAPISAAPGGADAAVPAKRGRKKLVVIALLTLLALLLAGGGGAFFLMKKKAVQATEEGAETTADAAHAKPDLKHPPTFLQLDPFVVNLSDREVDRYAQIGITLEVEDAKFAEQMKAFMPAIRNSILMILAHKSSRELLERAGKEELAAQVLVEASRTMGIEVEAPKAGAAADADADADADVGTEPAGDTDAKGKARAGAKDQPTAKKKPKGSAAPSPIRRVHFSNFIVQ